MIKLEKEQGNFVLYFTNRIFAHTVNQWKREIDEPVSFDIINIYIDRDQFLDRYDLGIILFGIGVSLKVNTFDKSEILSPEVKERIKKNIPGLN